MSTAIQAGTISRVIDEKFIWFGQYLQSPVAVNAFLRTRQSQVQCPPVTKERSIVTNLEDRSLDADQQFEVFGDRAHFALEVRHMPNVSTDNDPEASEGSWGEWRLWVAEINLCAFHIESDDENVEIQEVRWYLAPLFEWLVANWMPLLHEKRLPVGGRFVGSRPPSARAAYLSMLETAGDDLDRFHTWQIWAERHALSTAAEGGIVPDVFFQRMEDEIEISWGDRTQPGADDATFIAEDSIARVSADKVAEAFYSAIEWFSKLPEVQQFSWCEVLSREWDKVKSLPAGQSALSWYLDGSPERKP